MLTTLVFCVLALQPETVTFTHRCARAETVVAALCEELGWEMKVSGSVKDDYFLVRFVDTPVELALERIAETLNATWSKTGETTYLTRTAGQERAEQEEELAAVREAIARYAEKNRVPQFPGRDELNRLLLASAEAAKTKLYTDDARRAIALHPDKIYHNTFFQMLDHEAMALLPQDGYYFMSLRPHSGLVTMSQSAVNRIAEIEEYRTLYSDVAEIVNMQSGDIGQGTAGPHKNMLRADELLFGVVRDQFTLEFVTYRLDGKVSVSSSGSFIDLLGQSGEKQDVPKAKGTFETSIDRTVAQVFSRPRQQSIGIGGKIFDRLMNCVEDDPLSWLASEPILQAAESEGWDVVAVLPDALGWNAYWWPGGPGQNLGTVLARELTGWSVIEFDEESGYLSVKPRMAGIFRRSRIDREQVVKTIEALKAHEGYVEEIAEFYEWKVQGEERSNLMRLLACSIEGLRTNSIDMQYDDDAMMLLGSMSDSEQRRARGERGLSIAASQVSAGMHEGLTRLIGRTASASIEAKFDSEGKMLNTRKPAIVEFLISDPAQTMINCRIVEFDQGAAVLFQFQFPSGETFVVSSQLNVPKSKRQASRLLQ